MESIVDEFTPITNKVDKKELKCFSDIDPSKGPKSRKGIFENKMLQRRNIDDFITEDKNLASKNIRLNRKSNSPDEK